MSQKYFIDCDDFAESNDDWHLISSLKKFVPNLKLNLFTIPGCCTQSWIENMREFDWLRMYPHGYVHRTSRECEQWSYEVSNNYLAQLERTSWPKLWKSPGWVTSDSLYQCLADREWVVAAQEYDRERIPNSLRVYYLDSPNKIHGHIGHWGAFNSNSLELIFESIASLKGEFGFIDEVMESYEIQKI